MRKIIFNTKTIKIIFVFFFFICIINTGLFSEDYSELGKADQLTRLKFLKKNLKLKNDTAVIEFYQQNTSLGYSIQEIKIISKTIKENLSLENATAFVEEQLLKNETNEELKQLLNEYKEEAEAKKFEKMRIVFLNAESLFNAGQYEKARQLYESVIEMSGNSSIFEATKTKERLTQIKKKLIENKISRLRLQIENDEQGGNQAYYTFFKDFAKDAQDNDKKFFESNLIKSFEINKIDENLNLYNSVNSIIELPLKKKSLHIICLKYLDAGDDVNFNKYFSELTKISSSTDTEAAEISKKYSDKKMLFYLKIFILFVIVLLGAATYFFRKKIIYKYLKIKTRYCESTGERFELFDLYIKLLEYEFDEEIQIKLLKLSFELKKSENYALSLFSKIFSLDKLDYSLLFDIIKLQYKNGKIDELFKTLKKAKELHKDIDLQMELLKFEFTSYLGLDRRLNAIGIGAEIFKLRFEPQIIRDYIELLCAQGEFSNAFTYLKLWLNTQQNAIRKIAEFTETLIKKYPEQIKFYDFIGIVYRKLGDIDKAIEVYEMLEEKHQNKLPVYSALHELYSKKKDLYNSIRALSKIVMIREDNKEDKYNLGLLYYEAKEYDQTVKLMTELLIKDQNHLRAIDLLKIIGYSYLKDKEYDKTIKIFEFITSTSNIEITDVRIELGNLYINANNPDAAISTLQKITTGDKGIILKSQVFVARALILKKDHSLASEILKQIDENDPFINSEVKKMITYYKALCYENMGDDESAKKYYQVVVLLDIKYKDANDRYRKLIEKS